jgi:hypothetical protein
MEQVLVCWGCFRILGDSLDQEALLCWRLPTACRHFGVPLRVLAALASALLNLCQRGQYQCRYELQDLRYIYCLDITKPW